MTDPRPAEAAEGSATAEALLRLVTAQLRAAGVERVLDEWLRQGVIGRTSPASAACPAIVGAACAMEADDLVFGTARDLPAAFARGLSVETALRQALGADGDPALGRALPGAVRDLGTGVTLSDSGPASHLVHAAGFGHAAQLGDADRVALGLFGSGAQGNGEVHAAFNFAAVMRSRVVFVARGALGGELEWVEAAPAWGIAAVAVDGADGFAVRQAVAEARARATAGEGPTVIDARLRSTNEDAPGMLRDVQRLEAMGGLWSARRGEIVEGLARELDAAVASARGAAPVSEATLHRHLFAET